MGKHLRRKHQISETGLLWIILFFSCSTLLTADDYLTVNYRSINQDQPDRPCYVEGKVHYQANRAPLQPSPFMKLPVGAIEPQGWLGSILDRMRFGLAGQLNKISPNLNKDHHSWLAEGGNYYWEELPYWIRGYTDLAIELRDPEMIAEATIWNEGILKTGKSDGYFGPCPKDDLWPNMLALFSLQSYYEYTKNPKVIDLMTDFFAWVDTVPDGELLKVYWANQRGGDLLYSVLWLYNQTGDEKLLKTAEKIRRNTADWWNPVLQNWHNVNIAQCFRTPALWWQVTGDPSDLKATYNNFWQVRAISGQVPGGMFGGDELVRPGCGDPRQGSETCGIFEQMTSDMILLRITGDTFWADHCENVAFNTAPACTLANFQGLRYITSPNQPKSDSANHSPGINNPGGMMQMSPNSCFICCQHNHGHGWPYYMENMWLATPDGGLATALYGASKINAIVADGQSVTISEETKYPFEETILFSISELDGKFAEFPIYFRIPSWTKNVSLQVNGEKLHLSEPNLPKPGTWFRLNRSWTQGDTLSICFPMELNFQTWQANKNAVSLNYGPLTFSLKIKEKYVPVEYGEKIPLEWPVYDIYPDSDWNYGLIDPTRQDLSQLELIRKEWPVDQYPWSIDSVPFSIKVKGKKISQWGYDSTGLCGTLPFSPVQTSAPTEEVELIPMGSARLRISVFPTVEE